MAISDAAMHMEPSRNHSLDALVTNNVEWLSRDVCGAFEHTFLQESIPNCFVNECDSAAGGGGGGGGGVVGSTGKPQRGHPRKTN
jgi:hypothetical protein